jgi:hypothetical protein
MSAARISSLVIFAALVWLAIAIAFAWYTAGADAIGCFADTTRMGACE